ncbi:glycosyltransferase family 4 protein [Stutzerimonas nitrititolerans]
MSAAEQYRGRPCPVRLLLNDTNVPPRCRIGRPKMFTVGYCGQLTKRKNVGLLIQAFKLLSVGCVQLLIQGAGVEKERLRQESLGNPHIVIRNWESNTERFFEEIDIFVLPSLFDDFSNAALDAIAYGLPILISSKGGTAESVSEFPEFRFDPYDGPLSLAKKVEILIANYSEACMAIGSVAGKHVFSWEINALEMIQGCTPEP